MKISYSNFPILEKLQNGSLGIMPVFEEDKSFFDVYLDFFVENWNFYHKKYLEEINVISDPFFEASMKAKDKILNLWKDVDRNNISDIVVNGSYVYGDFVLMISYNEKKGTKKNETSFFIFNKAGVPLAFFVDSEIRQIYQTGWVSSSFSIGKNTREIELFLYVKIGMIVILKMFKDYADVETKIIPPNSRVKKDNYKYINDTKLELTYLDSKWFTNIVKSDGFSVRGHFRLQPKKKNGQWTKEIIFISEFQKTGYTSRARKLSVL